MTRLRFNFMNGVLSQAVMPEDTVFSSLSFSEFPSMGSSDHIALVLDPGKQYGDPEIVHIVEHLAGSVQATVERGREGTTARSHVMNTPWIHGLLVEDFDYIQGPEGPPGPDFTYRHSQEIPQQNWIIEHNLGGFPNVTVVDSAGSTVEGAIRYHSADLITIEFMSAFSGSAYLS